MQCKLLSYEKSLVRVGKVNLALTSSLVSRASALSRHSHSAATAVGHSRHLVLNSSLRANAVLSRLLATGAGGLLGANANVTGFLAAGHVENR